MRSITKHNFYYLIIAFVAYVFGNMANVYLEGLKSQTRASVNDNLLFHPKTIFIYADSENSAVPVFFDNEDYQELQSAGSVSPRINYSKSCLLNTKGSDTTFVRLVGVSEKFPIIEPIETTKGRFILEEDIVLRRKVCFVGFTLAHKLAINTGEYLSINGHTLLVKGVFASNSKSDWGNRTNTSVLMPYTAMQDVFGLADRIDQFSVLFNNEPSYLASIAQLKAKKPIEVYNYRDAIERLQKQAAGYTVISWVVLVFVICLVTAAMLFFFSRMEYSGIKGKNLPVLRNYFYFSFFVGDIAILVSILLLYIGMNKAFPIVLNRYVMLFYLLQMFGVFLAAVVIKKIKPLKKSV